MLWKKFFLLPSVIWKKKNINVTKGGKILWSPVIPVRNTTLFSDSYKKTSARSLYTLGTAPPEVTQVVWMFYFLCKVGTKIAEDEPSWGLKFGTLFEQTSLAKSFLFFFGCRHKTFVPQSLQFRQKFVCFFDHVEN